MRIVDRFLKFFYGQISKKTPHNHDRNIHLTFIRPMLLHYLMKFEAIIQTRWGSGTPSTGDINFISD